MQYTTRFFTMRVRYERIRDLLPLSSFSMRITKDDKSSIDVAIPTTASTRYWSFVQDAQALPMTENGQYQIEILMNGVVVCTDRVVLLDTYTYFVQPTLSLPQTVYA
jgi:hypothetical protein